MFFVLVILIVLMAAVGASYQISRTAADARLFPPPGRLITIAPGRRLHLDCRGNGERVRVRRFFFFRRREVVTCKLCRGRGACPFCWSPSEAATAPPQPASRRRGLRSVGGGPG